MRSLRQPTAAFFPPLDQKILGWPFFPGDISIDYSISQGIFCHADVPARTYFQDLHYTITAQGGTGRGHLGKHVFNPFPQLGDCTEFFRPEPQGFRIGLEQIQNPGKLIPATNDKSMSPSEVLTIGLPQS